MPTHTVLTGRVRRLAILAGSIAAISLLTSRSPAAETAAPVTPAKPAPFFAFGASRPRDPGVLRVLAAYLNETDYISTGLAVAGPTLGRRIGAAHRFQLLDSLAAIRAAAKTGTDSRQFIFYDIEHWASTPEPEQRDPAGSIAAAARIAHATPGLKLGIAPDGRFMGVQPDECAVRAEAGIYRQVDWSQVDYLNLQAQRLLSDACADRLGLKAYIAFVTTIVAEARRMHPGIIVSAQFSFRYTPPEKMIAAIQALVGSVDGFYLAYPDNSSIPNAYCTPTNLEQVLRAFRPRRS